MTSLLIQRLSEVARHVVAPAGVTATGWPAVARRRSDATRRLAGGAGYVSPVGVGF